MPLFDLASARDKRLHALAAHPATQTSGIPARKRLRYEEMIEFIERLVAEGNLAPGDMLPTQAELAAAAGVSLITVRRALEELERAGRVRRHQGVGTFLAKPRIITEPGRSGGLLDTLRRAHDADGAAHGQREPRVGNRLLSLGQGLPSDSLRAALRLADGAPAWEVRRQRLVNGEPKVYETAVIPVALAPGLDRYTAELNGSLYELLAERYGLEDQAEEQYLEVAAADDDERRLLRLPSKSQVVRLRGLSTDQHGTPFDCFTQVYPALEFGFYISGGTSRGLLRTTSWDGWGVTVTPDRSEEKKLRDNRHRIAAADRTPRNDPQKEVSHGR
ncbi:MAG TPA: GntR family transcriptional regulator [Trebonia sp.]|jgi:GntR family transcriptional regulator|nr:GntR family transcriptional regulator [Trebonia sp.]